jgi:ABC-2 type transport system permease protein
VGFVDVDLVTTVAMLVFHISFCGNRALLLLCLVLYLMTTLGADLFLSTISQIQQQAMMANFFFTTPSFTFPGFAFPHPRHSDGSAIPDLPEPAVILHRIVPGLFLKGVGASIFWPQMTALAVSGVSVITLSALRFHKKLGYHRIVPLIPRLPACATDRAWPHKR